MSGMYSGSVTDSVLGSGTAAANFAVSGNPHSGGDPLGGWVNFTFGSTTYSNPLSAHHPGQCEGGDVRRLDGGCGGDGGDVRFMDGGGSTALHGVFASIIGSAACTFVFTANFNPSTFQLNGSYKARAGCTGENGTFTLTQQCYYPTSGNAIRRTTGSGPGQCT